MKGNVSLSDLSNPRVFEEVFNTYYSSLCGFAFHYLEDHYLSEEMVQGVLSYVWENASDIHIRTNVRSYLLGSVRNACLNYLKHQQVENKYVDHVRKHPEHESLDFMELDELQEEIEQAMASLPEKCRQLFEMSRFGEKSYREIATPEHICKDCRNPSEPCI